MIEYATHPLSDEDEHLVELVSVALEDPDLDDDLRVRLHAEIGDILRQAHEQAHRPAPPPRYEQSLPPEQSRLPELLASVLLHPNLHTDTRMRLHREIPELVEASRHRAQVKAC